MNHRDDETPEILSGGALEIVNPASAACHWVESLAQDTSRLVASLPQYSNEDLIEFRATAERLHYVSWIAICAADQELMSRANKIGYKKAGDLTQQGIYATAQRAAKALGVSPETVRRNAQLFANFQSILMNPTASPENARLTELLPDKLFWLAASEAPDGQMRAALDYFADQKEQGIRFSTRDAFRWVREQKAAPLIQIIPSLADEPEVKNAITTLDAAIDALNRATAHRLAPVLKGMRQEIVEELQLPPMTIVERIALLIEDGYDEADIIRERGAWDRDHVIAWLRQMTDEGWLQPFEKPRIEGARGAARMGYTTTPKLARAIRELKRAQVEANLPDLGPADFTPM